VLNAPLSAASKRFWVSFSSNTSGRFAMVNYMLKLNLEGTSHPRGCKYAYIIGCARQLFGSAQKLAQVEEHDSLPQS
jgi:hypothetical protein